MKAGSPFDWGPGYHPVPRAIFNPAMNPYHPKNTGEEASEPCATVDLLMLAQWEARNGVPRGGLAHSLPFFEDRWNWTHGKVQRFFARLVRNGVITRHPQLGNQPMITVFVNFDPPKSRYARDTPVNRARDTAQVPSPLDVRPPADTPRRRGRRYTPRYQVKEEAIRQEKKEDYGKACPFCNDVLITSSASLCTRCGDQRRFELEIAAFQPPTATA